MPDRMPNRMSEDMSDRMPEDLPVRKCINVMVGITRSKVIFVKPGLSEFRAVSAQKKTFWSPVQGLMPKKINAKRRISNLTYKQ